MNGKRSTSWWALVALLLASGACGGSGGDSPEAKADDRAGASSTSSSSAKEAGDPSSSGDGAASGSTGPSQGGEGGTTATTARGQGSAGGGTPSSPAVRRAALDRPCVRQGMATDIQGLTVRNMRPKELMSYATVYSDNSTKFSHPTYESGDGYGEAGPDGVYRATWVVPATAPLGQATVRLVTFEEVEPMDLTFTIVGPQETCP